MSRHLDNVGNLDVTQHAGRCCGCGRSTYDSKVPVYQLTSTDPPVRWVTLCEPCIRQVISIIEGAKT
jgi:hypothetical protein